ncbi:dynamin family protein [Nonomuraea glycinis]|nr:dynamin family protein [Nonomuraea glycinis]MCA2182065.1 dynamin family protein [Nonomuraea glycinis]
MDDEHDEAPGEQTLQFRALIDLPADHDAAPPSTEATTEVDAEADETPKDDPPETPEPPALTPDEPEASALDEPEASALDEPEDSVPDEVEASALDEPEASALDEPEASALDEPEASALDEPEASAPDEPEGSVLDGPDGFAPDESENSVLDEVEGSALDGPEDFAPDEPGDSVPEESEGVVAYFEAQDVSQESAPVAEATPWTFAAKDAEPEADESASAAEGVVAYFEAQDVSKESAPVAEATPWAFAAKKAAKPEAVDPSSRRPQDPAPAAAAVPAPAAEAKPWAFTTDADAAPSGDFEAAQAPAAEREVPVEDAEREVTAEKAAADSVPHEGGAEGTSGGTEDGGPAAEKEEELPAEAAQALMAAIGALRESVAGLRFGLDLPGADEAKQERADLVAQLEDYVLPRVRMRTAPALIVIAGSTGAGKSTLVNSLAERNVSRTGVRRPTTGVPVLVCHPDDQKWFAEGELLGRLRRIDKQTSDTDMRSLMVVATEKLPQGVALLDTPDIDSVVEEHHEIAHRMLDAADLWIFVTTAARYADAPAWNLLRLAKERGARLAIVLSRVQPKARDVVVKHFVRMLTEYGMGEIDRFVISESKVADGKLPDSEVTDLRLWLAELSVDEARRALAVKETLNGVLDSFRTRVPALARHLEKQVAVRTELRGDVDRAFMGALTEIDKAFGGGALIHGEVLARWQDFSGSGDLMRSLQIRKNGRVSKQASERIIAFRAALRAGLESVIIAAANRACEEVIGRWRHRAEVGATLGEGLDQPSDELLRHAGRAVSAWQEHITELVRTEGVAKRSVSKLVSFDPDSLSLIFMVAMFSGGRTEGVPHRLVKALLGAESLRGIGAKALSDLRARIGMLFDEESMRYVQALDSAGVPDESAATRLYQATYNLEVAR